MLVYFVLGHVATFLAGAVLSYLYARKVIADYKDAAQFVGLTFKKIEGRIVAVKKAL